MAALKSAAAHMPRVDAVGVSSAGIFINNRTMAASLFLQVPKDLFDRKVTDIYIRAITDTFGPIPYSVVNDGDVSALAGAIRAYIATGEPMDKAGAYAIQGLAAMFVIGIDGDYYNVMGLPVCTLATILRKLGVQLLR